MKDVYGFVQFGRFCDLFEDSRDHDTFALLLQNLTMEQNPPRIFTRRNYLELNKFEIYVGNCMGVYSDILEDSFESVYVVSNRTFVVFFNVFSL